MKTLKAIGAAGWKGSGLQDYRQLYGMHSFDET